MAVKRRIIWMDDLDWERIRSRAAAEDETVSAFLRHAYTYGSEQTGAELRRELPSMRPFAEFRPAPKPGRK